MTLLDYPGKVACTVFLAGCNYRCPYCHNSELIDPAAEPVMTDNDLLEFLKKRLGRIEGVAITGGEPLFTKEITELIKKIKSLGYPVKLDTNGCYPHILKKLIDAALVDYVAMDIKNSPEKYAETVGLNRINIDLINESIRILLSDGCDYEFRTTVVSQFHDDESFYKIGEWIRGARHYYLQPFTDRETVQYKGFTSPLPEKIHLYADIISDYVQEVKIRGL